MERGQTWDKGKGFDTFGPIGSWLVTADEIGNPGNTKTMIFDVATIVSYCSMLMTLEPGDVMTLGIEKLGEQKQTVVKFKTAKA